MLLLIDNYDSFTWNLVQALGVIDESIEIKVVRNDKITVDEALQLKPRFLVLSPGPCTPKEAGICTDLVGAFRGKVPVLGVCLGHQAIGDAHSMVVKRSDAPMHGKTSPIHHDSKGIFRGLSNPFVATRYHSLVVDRATIGSDFEVSAWTDDGTVMGIRWRAPAGQASMDGVQFHPESFLTVEGPQLLRNFLNSSELR